MFVFHKLRAVSVLPCVAVVVHSDVCEGRLPQAGGLLQLLDGSRMETARRQLFRPLADLQARAQSYRNNCNIVKLTIQNTMKTVIYLI